MDNSHTLSSCSSSSQIIPLLGLLMHMGDMQIHMPSSGNGDKISSEPFCTIVLRRQLNKSLLATAQEETAAIPVDE